MRSKLLPGVILSFLILFNLTAGVQLGLAEKVPSAVKAAAEKGLPTMLKALPQEVLAQFNFSSSEELDLASLGTPFQVYTIPPEEILNYNAGTPIGQIIFETDHWFFPVTVKGEVRTLLTVAKVEGKWQAVSIGSAGLAKEWTEVVAKYNSYTLKLIRIYQAAADFVLLGDAGTDELLPMTSGRVALGYTGDAEPMDPAETIFKLQGAVQKNIEEAKQGTEN